MLRNWKWLLIAIVALGLSADYADAQKPSKNSPPPPPPVYYQVQFWTVNTPDLLGIQEVHDSNSLGQTVGYYFIDLNGDGQTDGSRAFMYDPADYDPAKSIQEAVDLNQVVQGIPEGSIIRQARAINEVGQIVAYLGPNDTAAFLPQPVVIDLTQEPPRLYAIPDRDLADYSIPGDINNFGDIVVSYRRDDGSRGHYTCNFDVLSKQFSPLVDLNVSTSVGHPPRINDAGDIVGPMGSGDAYRFKNGDFQTFSSLLPLALNEYDAFSGQATVASSKNRQTRYAFVYDTSLRLFQDSFANTGIDLNNDGDVLRHWNLYHSGLNRTFVLRDLLDPRDPDTVFFQYNSQAYCYAMTDREPLTGFPVLTGIFNSNTANFGIQLFPVPVPTE